MGSETNLANLGSFVDLSEGGSKAVIEFTATQSAVLEQEGRVKVGIRRYGKLNHRVLFRCVMVVF